MTADHPASAPPKSAPTTYARIAAGSANGETRRISSRSGSGLVTLSPPVSKPDDVHAGGATQDEPDRQEHILDPEQPVEQEPQQPEGEDAADHRRRDRPSRAHARPLVVLLLVGGHGGASIGGRPEARQRSRGRVSAGQRRFPRDFVKTFTKSGRPRGAPCLARAACRHRVRAPATPAVALPR